MLRLGLVMAFGALVGLAPKPADAKGDQVSTFTLDNGMEVVVIEDHRAPAVVHMVWYRAGSADEPRGASGIAHFTEHLMFKATDALEAGEFSKVVLNGMGVALWNRAFEPLGWGGSTV